MEQLKAVLKQCPLFILAMAVTVAGCSGPTGEISGNNTVARDSLEQTEDQIELTLYFPNLSYDPENPDSKPVIPVNRFVQKTEAVARAIITELLRGPSLRESREYNVAPIVAGGAALIDIYVKDGICVVHLDSDDPLFSGLSMPRVEVEKIFIQSIIYSLKPLTSINAVWLFYQESPWQGEFWQYFGPIAVREQDYILYYRNNNPNSFDEYIWETMIAQVKIVLQDQYPLETYTGGKSGPFHEIIEELTSGYDQDHGPTLPKGCSVEEFELYNGILTIHLNGRPPAGHQATRIMIRSLVYTFTELPEVKRVMATLNGEPFSDGHMVWDIPLGREDLE